MGELSLEERLAHRADALKNDVLRIAADLKTQGVSERGLAGYLSCLEYLNDLVGGTLITAVGKEREQFVIEFQSALRKLVHGLTMGEASNRQAEQLYIAKSPGKLRTEIAEALARANGSGISGPEETVVETEQRV